FGLYFGERGARLGLVCILRLAPRGTKIGFGFEFLCAAAKMCREVLKSVEFCRKDTRFDLQPLASWSECLQIFRILYAGTRWPCELSVLIPEIVTRQRRLSACPLAAQ